ncbi:UNVERIFIED_CONTAM: hypothetical protein Sradi_3813900 [Sesamum radiatum]|uniref:Uncharacterized protein n=1 Tax=Sesamum radiatum TaxID=300843 RepID=A0AAW2Q0S3_SESRA
MKNLHKNEHDICAIDSINTPDTDNVNLVKCVDLKDNCIEHSNGNNLQGMKEEHKEATNFVDTGHGPNRKKRWRNQAYGNGGLYKEHTEARDEFHIKKKKFKDGDKRHHKNKGPIKVDWQRIKYYREGTLPPPMEHPCCHILEAPIIKLTTLKKCSMGGNPCSLQFLSLFIFCFSHSQ